MMKREMKRIISDRMRNPNTSTREFIRLAEMYFGPDWHAVRGKEIAPQDKVDEMVLQLEKQRQAAAIPAQPAKPPEPKQESPQDASVHPQPRLRGIRPDVDFE